MTSWQRPLRAAIAVFVVGFVAVLYFASRQPRAPVERSRAVARQDPSASMESTGCEILQSRGTREDFRIECERSLTYGDGRQRILGARITVINRRGRDFTITGREAEVGEGQQQLVIRGDVKIVSSDGLTMTTPEATYNRQEGMVRANGNVAFSRGRLSGRSVGMTYDEKRDLLWLLDRAVIRMESAEPGEPPLDIVAGTAGLARPERYARFERGFELTQGGRRMTSGEATAFLSDDESRVESLDMRGNSRVAGLGDAAGALRAMAAQDINLELGADGQTLTAATLSRQASMEVAAAGPAPRRISGGWIDVRMEADGTTLSSLMARDGARLDLPGDAQQPPRTISGGSLVARGEAGKGLTSAVFSEGVEYRETRPPSASGSGPPAVRVARSKQLDLAVQPGFSALDDAKFAGEVRFEEGTVRASAAQARYRVNTGVLELEGRDESTGLMPAVTDERVAVEAQRVTLTIEGRKIVAKENVRTTMQGGAGGGGEPVKRPSMLKSDQAVFATAGSLQYDGGARTAAYETGVRLWQGDTAIQGDRVALDETTGNLTAKGRVRSTLMLDEPGDPAKPAERVATIASADDLAYDEAARRARYAGTAHVSGSQGDLRAKTIELYLKESGSELERVEAYETVSLTLDARLASGDRLTFFAADRRYQMVGTPVRMEAECRETVGRALTFFRSNDTIVVDGNNEFRTYTKSGAKCGAPRTQ